jgi:hypothetical protein
MVATDPTKALESRRAMASTVEASMVESMEENMDPVARAMEKASATGTRLHRLQDPRSTSPKASQTPLHRPHLRGTSTQSPPTTTTMLRPS